ncbi:MAG: HlyD family efflux transporter periplasmic adaptor subunit [Planctomycetes bacterium]|nr:HlyD family efflux transporter periplasmic adaptor subunit [Planctomycetota bacterium]
MSAATTQHVQETQAAANELPREFVHALVALAHRAHTTGNFARAALACAGRHFHALHARIELRTSAQVLNESWTAEDGDPAFWNSAAEQSLTEVLAEGEPHTKLFRQRSGELALAIVAAPVLDARACVAGALCLLVPVRNQAEAERLALELSPVAALVGLSAHSIESARAVQGSNALSPQALRRASDTSSRLELAITITNSLRTKTGSDQVALGLVRGKQVEVLSISGLDEVKQQSHGVVALRGVMEECLDHGDRTVHQQLQDFRKASDPTGHRLVRQWHQEVGGAAVAALPLRTRGRISAVLALRRAAEHPFTREELDEIARLVDPYGPALDLVERAHQGLRAHARRTFDETLERLRAPRTVRRALALVALAGAFLWLAFGTRDYQLSLPARVIPGKALHLCAAFEGPLAQAQARAGDSVQAGELLARFDTRELELERERLEHERKAFEIEGRRAFAAGQLAQSEVCDARAAESAAALALVERKIALSDVRAPVSGVVLAGDLSKRVGGIFAKGEALFEVAPMDHLALEIQVPESSVGWLSIGQAGRFAGFARPEDRQEITLTRIAPAAQVQGTQTVFSVEAGSVEQAAWMRPGMEGMALIEVGERPLWWVLSHQALDWLHMHVWL